MKNVFARDDLDELIFRSYEVSPEYPWQDCNYSVYRHKENSKWFAVCMTIPAKRLGISKDSLIDIVNLKCRPDMLDWLWDQANVHPAYHMNKSHWISVVLDKNTDMELFEGLLDVSFELTLKK